MYPLNLTFFKSIIFVLLLCVGMQGYAVQSIAPTEKPLKIGVLDLPPFSYKSNGGISGIASDLWSEISKQLNINNQYILLSPDINAAISNVHNGKLDVAVGPIGLSSKRLELVNFTVPFFHGEYVFVAEKINGSFWDRFDGIFSGYALEAALFLFIVFWLLVFLCMIFEKKHPLLIKKNNFEKCLYIAYRFMMEIFGGGVPLDPETKSGGAVVFLWLFIANTYIMTVFAAIAATFVSGVQLQAKEPYSSVDQIANLPIAIFGGDTADSTAERAHINLRILKNSPEEAFSQVREHKAIGAFMLRGMAEVYLHSHPKENFYITTIKFPRIYLGFALNKNISKDLQGEINWTIAKIIENGTMMSICDKYKESINEKNCL